MSYNFVPGDSEYLNVASPVVLVVPLTLSIWANADAVPDEHKCLSICGDASNNHQFTIEMYTDDKVYVGQVSDAGGWAATSTTFSTGAWNHICGVFVGNAERYAFLNGGGKGGETTACAELTGLDRAIVSGAFVLTREGWGEGFDGKLAEAAIWDVDLSDEEVTMLAAGYSPLFVRPQNLLGYRPLIRGYGDRVSSVAISDNGTPDVQPHPPIIYPAMPQIITVPAAAVANALPMAMNIYRQRRV